MSNAATKFLSISSILIVLCLIPACSKDSNKQAESLLNSAEESFANHDYDKTLTLLDSIDKTYPKAIEIRKQAMNIRPKAIEGALINKIAENDSMLAVNLLMGDSLCRNLTKVDNPLEPYYISKSDANATSQYSVEGLHGRVAPDGMFYIIASSKGTTPFTTVILESDNGTAQTTEVNPDGERNKILDSNRVVTYIAGECDAIGKLLTSNPSAPVKVSLKSGDKTIKQFILSHNQQKGIIETYLTAETFRKCHRLRIEKNKLEKQLSISRQQIANTLSVD